MAPKKSRKTRKVRPYVVRYILLRGGGSHRSNSIPDRFTTKAAGQKAIERAVWRAVRPGHVAGYTQANFEVRELGE